MGGLIKSEGLNVYISAISTPSLLRPAGLHHIELPPQINAASRADISHILRHTGLSIPTRQHFHRGLCHWHKDFFKHPYSARLIRESFFGSQFF